jgi:hypothetical protein
MISREARRLLRLKLRTFPVVLVTGPRQCGKTTLARMELPGWKRLDLEKAADRNILTMDLQGFLERNPRRVVIDEAQRLPELFPALRAAVDDRRAPGRYVLTGSCDPALRRGISESLAGRVGLVELAPFSAAELRHAGGWGKARWFWGGFPPVCKLGAHVQKAAWLEDFVETVVRRDIPAAGQRLEPERLLKLLGMLAHVHGNLLNATELGAALGVSHNTVGHYLDVLEGFFLIRRLSPYFTNIGKRLTKSPKLYIRDSGVLHHLAGLRRPQDLETWPRRGASWEGFVLEEIVQRARLQRPGVRPFFWRTQAGGETDLILEDGRRKAAIEIKLGGIPAAHELRGLRQCMADLGLNRGFVVHGGKERAPLGHGMTALPWDDLLGARLPVLP